MAYVETRILSTAYLSSFTVTVNPVNEDASTIEMNFTKVSPQNEIMGTDTVTINVAQARQLVPDMGKLIGVVADRYNPFNPAHLIP
jgi:hypothetical protein